MKYNRGRYNQFRYGSVFGSASYDKTVLPSTNYTLQTRPNTGWGIGNYNTYGLEYGKTTRILYGDHVQFVYPIVSYKFVPKANFNTDY